MIGTICGLTYKVLMSYNYGHGFSIVPASRADDVSSITTAVYGLGSFLCTYFATWLMQLMHTDLVTPTWYVGAIGFILITVLDIFVPSGKGNVLAPEECAPEYPRERRPINHESQLYPAAVCKISDSH